MVKSTEGNTVDSRLSVVRRVMWLSGVLLAVMIGGGWFIYDRRFALSVLVGGLLANGSFWLLKMDIQRILQRVGISGGQESIVGFEKTRFFLRFYARLIVLGLLLFVIGSKIPINVVGLTLGLSSVMFSVVIIGLGAGKCLLPNKV